MKLSLPRANCASFYIANIVCFSLFMVSMGNMEFEAYRLIQYTTSDGQHFGSLSNSLNFAAAYYQGDIFRKVALLHFNELHPDVLNQIFQKNPMSLLILLPEGIAKGNLQNTPNYKVWEDIQQRLASDKIDIPVYFSFETADLTNLYNELKSQSSSGDSQATQSRGIGRMLSSQAEYVMVLSANEPKLLTQVNLDVLYGQINFKDTQDQSDQNPIIAISTPYDALAISPELSYSMESSGSSIIAALHMSKIFSQLLSELQQASNFKYDLMFILTPTGSLNHEGTAKFVDHLPSNVKERIKLVVCLDQMVNSNSSNSLYVLNGHLTEQDPIATQFVSELKRAAGLKKVKVDVKDATSSLSANRRFIQYEHQIYNEKGIPAITISANDQKYQSRYQKYSVFDTAISNDDLRRNILILSEALVKVIYTFQDKSMNFIIDNESIVSASFIEQMKGYLAKNPRAPHMIQRDSPVSKEFYKLLGQNVNQIKRMGVTIKDTQFYEEKLGNKISAHLVTSKLMELYVFFGILAYLIVLYVGLQKTQGKAAEDTKAKAE